MQTLMNASPSLPYISFFTTENAAIFWQYVRAILYVVMPLLTIYMATNYGILFIGTLRRAFSRNPNDIKPVNERDYDIKTRD
jgi:hypothetical protein